jgi:large conductance mechanosensitive channel
MSSSEIRPLLKKIENTIEITAKTTYKDYKTFINEKNVVGLAIGILIGTSFQSIVDSLVNDIFIPILSLISSKSLSETFVVLRYSGNYTIYNTRLEAKQDGSITFNYGNFIENIINFMLMSLILFFMVKLFTQIFKKQN